MREPQPRQHQCLGVSCQLWQGGEGEPPGMIFCSRSSSVLDWQQVMLSTPCRFLFPHVILECADTCGRRSSSALDEEGNQGPGGHPGKPSSLQEKSFDNACLWLPAGIEKSVILWLGSGRRAGGAPLGGCRLETWSHLSELVRDAPVRWAKEYTRMLGV